MRARPIAIAPAVLLLAACAFNRASVPVMTPPAHYEQSGRAPLPTEELDHWWSAFNDPQLTSLIEDALTNAPDARTADQRLLEAQATRSSTIAQTLPQGNLSGTATRKHTEDLSSNSNPLFPTGGDSETENLNFPVTWEIDLYRRIPTAWQIANSDLAAVRFNVEGSRAALAANVADAYFQAHGLAIQLADARETVRIETELHRIAEVRANAGIAPRSDVDRVTGDLSNARAQAAGLEAELHAQQRTILVLVGRGFDPTASLPVDAQAADPPPVPDAVPGELLTRRPDVREAEARLRGQIARQRITDFNLFPRFTINPGAGLTRTVAPGVSFSGGTITPTTTTTSTAFWSAGVGVSIPILDIPRLLAEIHAQDARAQQAVIAYEHAVQNAYGEADSSLTRLAADHRRIALLRDGEVAARSASNAARLRYQHGYDDLQSALSAEQAWRTTRSNLTAARIQGLRRAVQVYKALGGGWNYDHPQSVGAR